MKFNKSKFLYGILSVFLVMILIVGVYYFLWHGSSVWDFFITDSRTKDGKQVGKDSAQRKELEIWGFALEDDDILNFSKNKNVNIKKNDNFLQVQKNWEKLTYTWDISTWYLLGAFFKIYVAQLWFAEWMSLNKRFAVFRNISFAKSILEFFRFSSDSSDGFVAGYFDYYNSDFVLWDLQTDKSFTDKTLLIFVIAIAIIDKCKTNR